MMKTARTGRNINLVARTDGEETRERALKREYSTYCPAELLWVRYGIMLYCYLYHTLRIR